MNLGKGKIPWYSAGLQFECLQCGRCCAGPEQGYIWATMPEVRLIAEHLKMPVKELQRKFVRRVGFRMTIVEDPHTHDCVFLRQTKDGRGCSIYEVRPAQCRTWPFWQSNLANYEAWNSTAQACPGINKGRLYTHDEIRDKAKRKKWPALRGPSRAKDVDESNKLVVARVSEIYNWIDRQLANNADAGQCSACGKCCDFESYGHRLYVTTPEIIYFVEKIGIQDSKHFVGRPDCHLDRSDAVRRGVETRSEAESPEGRSVKKDSSALLRCARNDIEMTTGRCPYQVNGKCTVHPHRFSGCRIFCCKGDAAFQGELTESVIKKFKTLCTELQIPYRYVELPVALKEFLSAENAEKHEEF